jgi:soluble lytic murein transglycosylase-like protein
MSIARIESSFDPDTGDFRNVCNWARACGLMQLRPIALADIRRVYGVSLDPLDPIQSIIGAAAMFNINRRYLKYYTRQNPSTLALVASYNGGWTAGRNYMTGRAVPYETRNYLVKASSLGVA